MFYSELGNIKFIFVIIVGTFWRLLIWYVQRLAYIKSMIRILSSQSTVSFSKIWFGLPRGLRSGISNLHHLPQITFISSFVHMSAPSQAGLLIFTETSVLTPNLLASFPLRTLLTTDTSAKYPSMRPLQLCGFSSCFFFMLPISTPHPRTEQHVMCHSPLFFNGMYILWNIKWKLLMNLRLIQFLNFC